MLGAELCSNLQSLINKAGLNIRWRNSALAEWKIVSTKLKYFPTTYLERAVDYRLAYFHSSGITALDVSMVLMHDNSPCGIWPLIVVVEPDKLVELNEVPILPPLFISDISKKSERSIVRECIEFLDSVYEFLDRKIW